MLNIKFRMHTNVNDKIWNVEKFAIWNFYLVFIFSVFQCGICDASFEQARELKQHLDIIHPFAERSLTLHYQPLANNPSVKNRFECFICKIQLNTISDVRTHIKQHAYSRKCEICNKSLVSDELEQFHMCGAKELIIKCEYCNESFQSIRPLLLHLECKHDNRTMYQCQKCFNKLFGMKKLLDLHEEFHPKGVEKSFVCDQCPKRFDERWKLKNHLRSHFDESMEKKSHFYF